MTEREIFDAALAISDPASRASYLDAACGGNASRREHIAGLLEAHLNLGSFLELPASAIVAEPGATIEQPPREQIGTQIGPYKLIEQIGEGGMGTVWMAQQTEPVRRVVALKLIKAGMDSRQVIARFEAERQALAVMDHPSIARVLDAGTTNAGRPFFVMDLVRGAPITQYCDEHHLTPRQRLELFLPVCQAVQHAHQKGIIHRDLKPSNVLVALYDGRPVPKVIDFGVAKAAGQPLTEQTLVTGFGAIVGTLEYMSPEQAEFNQLDIDTRSDIYSLGVLLYELLTGSPPFTRKELEQAGMLEMLRVIREQEPSKPSTKLNSSDALPTLSANRGTEPARLAGLVRGELDWIVMKALEKDRSRRYETANGLAADLQRYLSDEPVQACPPSTAYRFRKLASRHRIALGTAATVTIALILGTVGTSLGLAWALRAERAAILAAAAEARQRQDAEAQRDRAQTAEIQAKEQAAIAEAVNEFLQHDLLAEAAPDKNARNKQVTVEELLGRAAARIEGRFDQQPRIEAALRQTIGDAYRALSDYAAAQPHLERALEIHRQVLGEEHLDTLQSMNNLALLYEKQGKSTLAEPLYKETLEVRQRRLGEQHSLTLESMNNLAVSYLSQGQYDLAEPLMKKALEIRRALKKDCWLEISNLAKLYHDRGKLDEAEPLAEEALVNARGIYGDEDSATLTSMNNLAGVYADRGKFDKAVTLLVEALDISQSAFGDKHDRTLHCMNNLGFLYWRQERWADAKPLFEKTLKFRREILGDDHPDTLVSMNNLAALYGKQRRFGEAIPLSVEALTISRRKLGENHPITIQLTNSLGVVRWQARELDLSIPLFEQALKQSQTQFGPNHPETLEIIANLMVNYLEAGRFAQALPLLEQTLEKKKATLGLDHPDALDSLLNLADCHAKLGQPEKGEPLLQELTAFLNEKAGDNSPHYAQQLAKLGLFWLKQGRPAEAEPLLRLSLTIRKATQPKAWSTFNTESMLGGSLLGQKKYTDAEPLLLSGYEGLKLHAVEIPPEGKARLTEAAQRLVQLYESTDRPEEAARWKVGLPEN